MLYAMARRDSQRSRLPCGRRRAWLTAFCFGPDAVRRGHHGGELPDPVTRAGFGGVPNPSTPEPLDLKPSFHLGEIRLSVECMLWTEVTRDRGDLLFGLSIDVESVDVSASFC